jgi:hypothetical protein
VGLSSCCTQLLNSKVQLTLNEELAKAFCGALALHLRGTSRRLDSSRIGSSADPKFKDNRDSKSPIKMHQVNLALLWASNHAPLIFQSRDPALDQVRVYLLLEDVDCVDHVHDLRGASSGNMKKALRGEGKSGVS